VNGARVQGPEIRSSLGISRPTERAIPLDVPGTDVEIALRTHVSPSFAAWRLTLFMMAAVGTPDAIEARRQAFQSDRLYSALPSIFINLLLIIAGIAAFALRRSQPNRAEYLWLGIYLLLQGVAYTLWGCQQAGVLPLSANFLCSDPLLYIIAIAQIEFTFSFGGQRVSRLWRLYEALLLAPLVLIWLTWQGKFPSGTYVVVEGIILLPVAMLLPIMLLLWYRRGNREAGWLILPSLLPAATVSTYDLGTLSIFFGWQRLDFLDNPIQFGPILVQPSDIGDLLFLLAIAVVMFFRFTRVSREQARSAAELEAAREIQQRLVPAVLPELAGFHLEAAYLPAQEVGGDFYQVIAQPDGFALIVVGDVSGKGLKAAMTGALAIGALRTLADENLSPGVLLARLNRQMLTAQESGFITCLCVRMSLEGSLTMANAGHLSPYRRGEEIELDSGLPLGLTADAEYAETLLQLAPGDTLTLLSDGVVEAMNPQRQLFGFERTRVISEQPAHNIAAAAQAFGQEDDITVLTVVRATAQAIQ
jgi:phosphoserine phosphatase RsbU/P